MTGALDPGSASHVRFVAAPTDAPPAETGTTNVVLDTAWTTRDGDRPDVVGVRPAISAVIERRDLYEEALARLDAWAEAAGLADRLTVEGVTYWFRMREPLWRWLHERLLWRHTLAALLPGERAVTFSAPAAETALVEVLRILGGAAPEVRAEVAANGRAPDPAVRGASRGPVDRVVRRFEAARRAPELRRREATLAERVAGLSSGSAPRIIVLTIPATHQRVGASATGPRDPHLGSVIPGLAGVGLEPVLIGMGLDQRDDADWETLEHADHLLPQFLTRTRWSRPEDEAWAAAGVASSGAALDDIGAVALDVDGIDLAPLLVEALRTQLARTVANDIHQLARVERLLAELRPAAILLTQEGIRTPWLVAGARAGVPVFAVQHGVLYPTHPGYPDRRHPRLVLAERTFVYGDYERRVLLGGAYRPDEVEVSGSPRLDLDAAAAGAGAPGDDRTTDRAAVRAELGVASGDRMLVVSTVHIEFLRRAHLVHMLARTLGGPMPGIHVVFKQHPGERDPGPYEALLAGLAAAGGYDAPPMTVVRDIDLYRLLRAADAHLGLHSTVLTDAVAAGTPNLIALTEGHVDLLGYVAAGVARPVRAVADVSAAMADPAPPDPAARQAFLDDHFRSGDASGRIAGSIGRTLAAGRDAPEAAIGARR
jgi:hypothetical protein